MSDSAIITLVSVVLSALITATGTVIAAYISKEKKEESQKVKVYKPESYEPNSNMGIGWKMRKVVVFFIIMGVIAVLARTLLSGDLAGLPSNQDLPTAFPSPISTIDPCYYFVSRVRKGTIVQTDNILDKNLNIRKLPSLSAPIITSVQNGTEFQILNGPICVDGLMWWEASTTNGNTKGWIPEVNSHGIYYIEPK